MKTLPRCACGKAIRSTFQASRGRCASCEKRHQGARIEEAVRVVEGGKCPCCGLPLKHNMALAGWYQCVAYACVEMRAPEFKSAPACSFQTFTR